jgi:UDP-N-acetylmuramoyl-tripeptide--D-alanyl-D-alanine ligase
VALVGERFDGHSFVAQAIAIGAKAAVVSRDWFAAHFPAYPLSSNTAINAAIPEVITAELVTDTDQGSGLPPLPLLIVPDTLTAYQQLGNWWRQQYQHPVIAVTGSVGKTTTKEMIASLLNFYTQPGHSVHKNLANHNNDIGVTQTLLHIDPSRHDFTVTEMGMRGLGEIARLCRIAQPTIGVITNIGTAHIGRLGSQGMIAQAKCELLAEMPLDGIAVLNAHDEWLQTIVPQVWQGKVITYGLGIGDVCGVLHSTPTNSHISPDQNGNSNHHSPLNTHHDSNSILQVGSYQWHLPLAGAHNALNFLAGLAVLKALDLDWSQTLNQPITIDLPAGRAESYELNQQLLVLDETYNASPEGMIAALHLLAQTPAKRRWAVLGTMKELGAMSDQLHQRVGHTWVSLDLDGLVVWSDGESDAIMHGANRTQDSKVSESALCFSCATPENIVQTLLDHVQPGDCVLFKASRSVGMDRVAQAFRNRWQDLSSHPQLIFS